LALVAVVVVIGIGAVALGAAFKKDR